LSYHWAGVRREDVEPSEVLTKRDRWAEVLKHDPYYNPNLSREHADFSIGE